jgi:ATP-dependent DNA ligase
VHSQISSQQSPIRNLEHRSENILIDVVTAPVKLEIPKPPFTKGKGLPHLRMHWASPEIVVQVAFIEWTAHGKLRHPRLIGIRYDKSPREVVRETW